MASKGHYVEGTDGSDSDFRMKVADQYKKLTSLKKDLKLLHKAAIGAYVVLAGLLAFALVTEQAVSIHLAILAGAFFPFLAEQGTKRNKQLPLYAFAVVSCLAAAYLGLTTAQLDFAGANNQVLVYAEAGIYMLTLTAHVVSGLVAYSIASLCTVTSSSKKSK